MKKGTSQGANHVLREYKASTRERDFDKKLEVQAQR